MRNPLSCEYTDGGGALTNAQWPTCSYTPYCCGSLSPRIELEPYKAIGGVGRNFGVLVALVGSRKRFGWRKLGGLEEKKEGGKRGRECGGAITLQEDIIILC